MKKFKKTILTIMLLFAALVLVKPEIAEAKTITKTYDIDKVSVDKILAEINTNGKVGVMFSKDKNIFKIKLTTKAKSEKEGIKKMKAFASKVKKSKNNKYGFSYGVKPDDFNYTHYDKKKKVYSNVLHMTANDIYYLNEIAKKELSEQFVVFYAPDKWIGDDGTPEPGYQEKWLYMSEIFPDAASFKKCSDSVKFEMITKYINSIELYTDEDKRTSFKWKYLYQKKAFGKCHELACMEEEIVRAIASDYDYKYEVNWHYNWLGSKGHALALVKVKRSEGTYDYFQINNASGSAFETLPDKYKNICTNDADGGLEVWMNLHPKEFLNDKIEKEAYKYGKEAEKNWGAESELTKLALSLNARDVDYN